MNNKRILLTAFQNTSAERLMKEMTEYQVLLLPNDKEKDSKLLIDVLSKQKYDYIISFGQRPNIKNKVHIETTAKEGLGCIDTTFDCNKLKQLLEQQDLVVKISHNAGTSFCNRLYWGGLQYILEKKLDAQMVFLHIPFEKNMDDIEGFQQKIFQVLKEME